VVCERVEAEKALAWAKAHSAWDDDDPALPVVSRLLAQTMHVGDWAVPLILDGSFGDFGTYRDLAHGHHRGRPFTIRLAATDDVGTRYELTVEFKYRTKRRQLILRQATVTTDSAHLITATYNRDSERPVIDRLGGTVIPGALRSQATALLGRGALHALDLHGSNSSPGTPSDARAAR
jgi:hypothetical protein